MNKFLKTLILGLVLVSSTVIEAYSNAITVTIVIARHRDCNGFGVCKLTVKTGTDIPFANTAIATISTSDGGHMVLTFSRSSGMSPEAYSTYFSKGVFVCEDDCPVPSEILKALQYAGTYTIKAGKYPAVLKGDTITVEL